MEMPAAVAVAIHVQLQCLSKSLRFLRFQPEGLWEVDYRLWPHSAPALGRDGSGFERKVARLLLLSGSFWLGSNAGAFRRHEPPIHRRPHGICGRCLQSRLTGPDEARNRIEAGLDNIGR